MRQTKIPSYLGDVVVTHPDEEFSMQPEGIYINVSAPSVGAGYEFTVATTLHVLGQSIPRIYKAVTGLGGSARIYLELDMLPTLPYYDSQIYQNPFACASLDMVLDFYEADIEAYSLPTALIYRGIRLIREPYKWPWRVFDRSSDFEMWQGMVKVDKPSNLIDLSARCNKAELIGVVGTATVPMFFEWTARRVESKALGEYYNGRIAYTPNVSTLTYDLQSAWELDDDELDVANALMASSYFNLYLDEERLDSSSERTYNYLVSAKNIKADATRKNRGTIITLSVTLPYSYSTDCLITI